MERRDGGIYLRPASTESPVRLITYETRSPRKTFRMIKPILCVAFGLLVPVLFAVTSALATDAPRRPNVITIMTDDQAAWTLGCYGNKECPTPNMDRLAREGARFANAFTVTPV